MKNKFPIFFAIIICLLIFSFTNSYAVTTGAWATIGYGPPTEKEDEEYLTPATGVAWELHISWSNNSGYVSAEATINTNGDGVYSWVETNRTEASYSPEPEWGEPVNIYSGATAYAYVKSTSANTTVCSWAFYTW